MPTNRYQTYIEEEILTADPVQLIQLLYPGALDSITSARRYLKLEDIRARSRAISKAMTIVTELSLSLNHAAGGDLGKNLAGLYAHTQTLLIQANVKQSDPPLAEAERLLSTLLDGWQACLPPETQACKSGASTEPSTPHEPVGSAY